MKIFAPLLCLLSITHCSMQPPKAAAKNIYANFILALGDESHNLVQCVAEFKRNGEDGKYIGLDKGATVFIDTAELAFDTTVYPTYSLERHPSTFIGNHTWTVKLPDGNKKEYHFEVVPFVITSAIPDSVGNTDVVVECTNLKSTDEVNLYISSELPPELGGYLNIKPADGYFTIPKSFFSKMQPISLEIYFNITRLNKISNDDYFGKGVQVEWTKVTRQYTIKVAR